jgi:exoribonuclease R
MKTRVAPAAAPTLTGAFARIRAELHVPGSFTPELEAEADAIAKRGPRTPPGAAGTRVDARDIPFVSIDPAGSKDLDQALHLERRPGGYRFHYAIADVAAFVAPGSPLDVESFARGVTLYLPDGRVPVLPNVLGEGAISLLEGQDRPALLWTIDLDAHGESTSARLERATVRNRSALAYADVQRAIDEGRADDWMGLLREVGEARRELERARGGVSLDLPSQEVVASDHRYTLVYEAPLPVEGWNAQLSLLAGMEAASMMVHAREGILRTLPPPEPWMIDRLHRVAYALHLPWPKGVPWGDMVRGVNRQSDHGAAFLIQAVRLLRGAGYAVLDAANTARADLVPVHAGVGAPYAHATAPLRRLADRYVNEIVCAQTADRAIPEWVGAALPQLVTTMEASNHKDAAVERTVVDAVECAILTGHEGEQFRGVVVDRNHHGVVVQVSDPAVVATVETDAQLGTEITLRLTGVDVVARRVEFEPAP